MAQPHQQYSVMAHRGGPIGNHGNRNGANDNPIFVSQMEINASRIETGESTSNACRSSIKLYAAVVTKVRQWSAHSF